MSMVLSGMVSTREPTTCSSSASRSTTMRSGLTNMFLVLFWSILSPELWTLSAPVLLAVFSAPTTSSLDRVVLVTTGQKDVSRSSCNQIYLSLNLYLDYTEGAELVDSVLDVVRKEAEGTDCLQGWYSISQEHLIRTMNHRLPNYPLAWWWYRCWNGNPSHV